MSMSTATSKENFPLSEPMRDLPQPNYSWLNSNKHETTVTVLENGMRVASENRYGNFCTVGGK